MNEIINQFKKAEKWSITEKTFTIEVYHFSRKSSREDRDDSQRWNVYVYIREDSPYFNSLTDEPYYNQDFINQMPFHRGCTFHDITYDENGKAICHKIGADYAHLHDEWFEQATTPEEAHQVFQDALDLRQWMFDNEPKEIPSLEHKGE